MMTTAPTPTATRPAPPAAGLFGAGKASPHAGAHPVRPSPAQSKGFAALFRAEGGTLKPD